MYDTTIFKSRPSLIEENPALLLWTLVLGAYVVFVMIAKYAWYITDQQIGISAGSGTEDWQRQVRDLQTQLTAERAKSAQLEADAKERQKLQSQMKRRLPQQGDGARPARRRECGTGGETPTRRSGTRGAEGAAELTGMVVFVHSLGSLWQEKVLPAGGARVWNTTGIRDGPQVRSHAKVFGQVKLGAKARLELARSSELTGVAWTATNLGEVNRCCKLALLCRAPRAAAAELFIVTVTESLVGELGMDSWDGSRAALISFSRWRSRQEVMLAMQPFAWLRGSTGSAVLVASGGKCDWKVTRW